MTTKLEKELTRTLLELYLDLNDTEADCNPETGKEYVACRAARRLLERIGAINKVTEAK